MQMSQPQETMPTEGQTEANTDGALSGLALDAGFGDAREVLSCSRTDWLIITNSPLTGPVLARKIREAETRGTVEIDERGRDVVLITFTPNPSSAASTVKVPSHSP